MTKLLTTITAGALLLAVAAGACSDGEEDVSTPTPSPAENAPPSPAVTGATAPAETAAPSPAQTAAAHGQINFDTLFAGQNSGVMTEETVAFKIGAQDAWADLWTRHASLVVPAPTLPPVALEGKMIVAVFDRNRSSGGFAVEVQSIVVGESGIVVEVLRTAPGASCVVTQAFTQPFHIVLADAAAGDVQLVLTDRISDC